MLHKTTLLRFPGYANFSYFTKKIVGLYDFSGRFISVLSWLLALYFFQFVVIAVLNNPQTIHSL